jgi:hypothetical protein
MHRACYFGRVRGLSPGVVGAVAWLFGCAGNEVHVRNQAAADMSCQPEQTQIVDAEVGIYLVRGCGQEASYKCPEMGSHCRRLFLRVLPQEAAAPEALTTLSVEEF